MITFQSLELDERLLRAIADRAYEVPTPVQERAIPLVLAGRDVLGKSRTGTGKTASFGLPILQRMLATGHGTAFRALLLAPTRELAEQLHRDLKSYAVHTDLKGVLVTGGLPVGPQEHAVRLGGDWLVATPGRLADLLRGRVLELRDLEVLVLDEADRLLELGFLSAIREVASYLPERRQTLFFSATLPPDTRDLARALLIAPETLDVDETAPAAGIREEAWPVSAHQKFDLLQALLGRGEIGGRVLVFTRTRVKAERLAARLQKSGRPARALHGERPMDDRRATLEAFREDTGGLLVATDLAARGLDVADVDVVLNYDVPSAPEDYIHRVGRTARAGKPGRALTFHSREELALLAQVDRLLGRRLPERRLEGFSYEAEDEPGPALRARQRGPANFSTRTPEGGKKVSPFTKTGKARPGFDAAPAKKTKPKKIRNKRLPHQR